MSTLHAQPASTTPIFTDPSGRRVTVLQWLARGLCACFVLVSGAVGFTLFTQVPLPGLGGLFPDRPDASAPRTSPAPPDEGGRAAGVAALLAPSTGAVDAGRQARPQASSLPRSAEGTTVSQAAASTGSDTVPASAAGTTNKPATAPGTPAANANSHATTKTRNPQAAPRQASPRMVKEPNEHAATGRGRVDQTDDSASTPPGRNK